MKSAVILAAAALACVMVMSEARFVGPFIRPGLQVQPRTAKAGVNQQPRVIIIKEDRPKPATTRQAPAVTRHASTAGHGNGYNNFLNDYLLADALDINHPGLSHDMNQYGAPFTHSARGGRSSFDPYYAEHVMDMFDAQPVGRGPVIVI
ncbi:uncharacterized protein [Haliotis asinina]|uniref:uncharacterized protein n=1 Tax=Haliotis asinina TaxID=109174 RepID=UPI0035320070